MRDKQPAITKHPRGTASFCFRVMLPSGANWEAISTRPQPIGELIKSIEGVYLDMLRNFAAEKEPPLVDARTTEAAEGTAIGSATENFSAKESV